MLFVFALALACVVFGTGAGMNQAQQPKPKVTPTPTVPEQDPESIRIPIRRVRLPITVVDKKGNFVPGLTKDDFFVLEDHVSQQIETFSDDLGQTLPLYLAVLMDTSPSTAGKVKFEQESAMNSRTLLTNSTWWIARCLR